MEGAFGDDEKLQFVALRLANRWRNLPLPDDQRLVKNAENSGWAALARPLLRGGRTLQFHSSNPATTPVIWECLLPKTGSLKKQSWSKF